MDAKISHGLRREQQEKLAGHLSLRDERIKESEEARPGVFADHGYDCGIVRFEVLRASKVVENAREMQFSVGA